MTHQYLISACLVGKPVRYDAQHCLVESLKQLLAQQKAVVICPEISGGLATPRLAAEIVGGDGLDVLRGHAKVIDQAGVDVSSAFIKGAYHALELAQKHQVTHVVLKANSPSCGSGHIYDGSFSGQKTIGYGVTSALLHRYGFNIMTEQAFLEHLKQNH